MMLRGERRDFPEPVALDYVRCRHCGGMLSAVGEWDFGVGEGDLIFTHVATGAEVCAPVRKAEPYDGWQARRAYEAALMAQEAQ